MVDRLEGNPSVRYLTPALCSFYLVFVLLKVFNLVVVILETTFDLCPFNDAFKLVGV